ncbi:LysR family transcriptional regulator [Motiliproteus coralliicola]|uniref:LysR family transcriptional regulator n=1 Tax=Motiliproteus coralliicola TaxID=2283196 RepID=A0A369WAT2_9GAMM|nr:LysR family transcriptional regulator [Motiliproteus coralliicola]RDE18767.1 LysR family transcriptional regulator [Motiliproteus coralliicola]
MDLRKLRIFVEVARHGSFSGAARALPLAQPAVSVAVQKLEQELDLLLFHRHDRRISLTSEGKVLLQHAQRMLEDLRQAQLEMDELKGLRKGEVRIGIPSMLGTYYFPELLMAFKQRYPQLKLSVEEAGARDIQQMIDAGELDMGIIVREQLPESLEAELFLREQMVVCLPPEHPLAAQPSVSFEQFFAEPLVLFKPGYFHRAFIDRLAQQTEYPMQIEFETNLIPLIRKIVGKGFGITTFLAMVAEGDSELAARPFSEPVWLDLCIAWKRGAYLSHADRSFVEFLLEHSRV